MGERNNYNPFGPDAVVDGKWEPIQKNPASPAPREGEAVRCLPDMLNGDGELSQEGGCREHAARLVPSLRRLDLAHCRGMEINAHSAGR